jgi:hypothetical protein
VRWKRTGAAQIYEQTKDLSPEQLLAWWQERNREFEESMARRRAERERAKPSP